MCFLEQGGNWDNYFLLIEFTYNNFYHYSTGMAPFESLYGRRCKTRLYWDESRESVMLGPDIVQRITEKNKIIMKKMKAS